MRYHDLLKAKIIFLFLGYAGLCLLCACSVGPRYHRPKTDEASWTWKKELAGTPLPINIAYEKKDSLTIPAKWWSVFHDNTLDSLVSEAFQASPVLKTAAYRIIEARGNVGLATSNFFPVISLDPYANRTRLSGNRPSPVSNGPLPPLMYNTFSVPLDVTYEIDVWGKFRRNFDGAEANLNATRADYEVVKLGLAADVVSNYLTLRLLDNQSGIFARTLDTRKQNYDLTVSAFKSGLNSQLDVAQAEIEMVTVEGQLSDILRNRMLTENALALLLGVPASNFKIAPKAALPETPLIPLEVPSDMLRRRPDIAEAEQELIYANAQAGIAVTNFLPSVKLNGTGGYLSAHTENLLTNRSVTWLGQATVNIPLFTGGRNIASMKIADARVREAEENYRQKILTGVREVQDALANIERRSEQMVIQQRALDAARRTSQLSVELYKVGLTNYVNVVLAQRSALDAENTLLGVVGQRLLYSVLLIKAMGGGWEK